MIQSTNKNDIRNLSLGQLEDHLASTGQKNFRAAQIFDWIYDKGVWSFAEMKNLPQDLKDSLSENFILGPHTVHKKEISRDGTTKFLFDLRDEEKIETVLIPTSGGTTVCLSTQVGCKFGCRFCASGIGGWRRNLTCAEIVTQLMHVKQEARQHKKPLSHVVFMGIGEPLDNYENLIQAIRLINDKKALNIGARRITVSTCGVIPKIRQLAGEGLQIELAVSLHGFDNESRNILMPVNRKYPFDDLMMACREYLRATKRQITFEYILIKDVTCTPKAAAQLKKAFKGLICKMNLIPYNPVSEFDHKTPTREDMESF